MLLDYKEIHNVEVKQNMNTEQQSMNKELVNTNRDKRYNFLQKIWLQNLVKVVRICFTLIQESEL